MKFVAILTNESIPDYILVKIFSQTEYQQFLNGLKDSEWVPTRFNIVRLYNIYNRNINGHILRDGWVDSNVEEYVDMIETHFGDKLIRL